MLSFFFGRLIVWLNYLLVFMSTYELLEAHARNLKLNLIVISAFVENHTSTSIAETLRNAY